jgi:hypothetical protein
MGTWGVGSFDNDEAADFISEILETNDLELLEVALNQSIPEINDDSLLDSGKACRALVSAELIAAIRGFAGFLPEDLGKWLVNKGTPTSELRLVAHSAVLRVLNDSELRELWEETDEYDLWKDSVRELLGRLSSPRKGVLRYAAQVISKSGKLTPYLCCFCGEKIRSTELITLTIKKKVALEQTFSAHSSCFDRVNILNPLGNL